VKKNIKSILNRLYRDSIIKTDFVGFIIKLRHISIDPKKIKAIVNWQDPENIIGLRLFLGFYNYYKRFIIK